MIIKFEQVIPHHGDYNFNYGAIIRSYSKKEQATLTIESIVVLLRAIIAFKLPRFLIAILFIWMAYPSYGQNSAKQANELKSQTCDAETIDDFFNCYGGRSAFSTHYQDAVTTFINAENALKNGDYQMMEDILNTIWNKYPVADPIWNGALQSINGANVGSPYAYYGLRMMDDIVDYQLNHANQQTAKKTIVMHVVLPECSEGIQPSTLAELNSGTGEMTTLTLDPLITDQDYRIVRQSLDLFLSYVTAITNGALEVELNFIELTNLCLEASVTSSSPYVADVDSGPIWDVIPDQVQDTTDWWWFMYPSFTPEEATFDHLAFITGGMGADAKGGPFFISNDTWIINKPPHLGNGNYTDIERRIYLPQWFMHEFYHHLYRIYPEFELEATSHQWFDRNSWPSDFQGIFEPDYYDESLKKRLQSACIPLAQKLKTAISPEANKLYSEITVAEIVGTYSWDNVQNDYHEADIIKVGQSYFWKNRANVQWSITPSMSEGKLLTGADSPYPGEDFGIDLVQNIEGAQVAGVRSLLFLGEKYKKRTGLFRDSVHVEYALGTYQRSPAGLKEHTGQIIKRDGQYYWEDEDNTLLPLFPNIEGEYFESDLDNPSISSRFSISFSSDECGSFIDAFTFNGQVFQKIEEASSDSFSPCLDGYVGQYELVGPQLISDHYITSSSIISRQALSAPSSINVSYECGSNNGESITLKEGFEVRSGIIFQAELGGCHN